MKKEKGSASEFLRSALKLLVFVLLIPIVFLIFTNQQLIKNPTTKSCPAFKS
jgi:hypothetical protein